jgi:hypothetical protein
MKLFNMSESENHIYTLQSVTNDLLTVTYYGILWNKQTIMLLSALFNEFELGDEQLFFFRIANVILYEGRGSITRSFSIIVPSLSKYYHLE